MSFMKVKIKQQSEGTPGFAAEDEFDVQIAADQITLFNQSEDDPDVIFVRLSCGATLCVVDKYAPFVKKLAAALKAVGKVVK